MIDIFISHAEEDAGVAIEIASGLEGAGYSTWYFERDCLPGVPYVDQLFKALDSCKALIVIISVQSLKSGQVSHEAMIAFEKQKSFIPILLGITLEEFQDADPEAKRFTGPSTFIIISQDGVDAAISIIADKFKLLGKHPEQQPMPGKHVELLASQEHERWMAERIRAGWIHENPYDNKRCLHPSLFTWDDLQLSSLDKEKLKDPCLQDSDYQTIMREMTGLVIVDSFEIYSGADTKRIELHVGDVTAIDKQNAVDVLIVSAFPNSYAAVPGSLIAALEQRGISVKDLAQQKAVDLRNAFSCWMSKELGDRNDINFKRILCFEPYIRGTPAELVGDIFRSLAPFVGGERPITTVATPLVASGSQGVDPEKMLRLLVEAAAHWMRIGLPITCFKIAFMPGPNTDSLKKLFQELKQLFSSELTKQSSPFKYDAFISYAHVDEKDVSVFENHLMKIGPSIKLFIYKNNLNPGAAWQQEIFESLDNCRKVVTFLTPAYLESRVCLEEFNIALCRNREATEKVLEPVYLRSTTLPTYMRVVQFWDCREGNPEKIEETAAQFARKLSS
jgi:hypothetical protein